jgi:hypothetical protein
LKLPRRLELGIVAALVLVAVVATAVMAKDMWFLSDEWEYVANRSVTDLDSMLRPYGGHWTTIPTLLIRGLYQVVGLDFWPWYYLPRLIGHTALAVLVWWTVRRRGADAALALFGLAVLLFLSASSYQRALQVGNWVVYAALIVVATVIERVERPSPRHHVLVAGALLLGVLGNGYAAAVLGGTLVAVTLARRLRTWLPSLLPPLVAYGAWYLAYRDEIQPKPELGPGRLLLIPVGAFRIVRGGIANVTGLPSFVAAVLVVVLVLWFVHLFRRGRLDVFDGIVAATLLAGLALLTIQRVAEHPEAAARDKYSYAIAVLLVLLVLPHVKLPASRAATAGVLALATFAVAANVVHLDRAIDLNEHVGQLVEARVASAASMLAAGEPVVPKPSIVVPRLDTVELQRLVDDGYDPQPDADADPALVEAARGSLRMRIVEPGSPRPSDGPAPDLPSPDADGCAAVAAGATLPLEVRDGGALQLRQGDETGPVDLVWTDSFGTGRVQVEDTRPVVGIELADPGEAPAQLEITASDRAEIRVCPVGSSPG